EPSRPAEVSRLLARARAALALLGDRHEVQSGCLFVVGHSEGGILAPELALEHPLVRGLVVIAAPGRDLLSALPAQLEAILGAEGASEEEIDLAKKQQAAAFKLLRHGKLHELEGPAFASLRWLGGHAERSPRRALEQQRVPVLALFGERDL